MTLTIWSAVICIDSCLNSAIDAEAVFIISQYFDSWRKRQRRRQGQYKKAAEVTGTVFTDVR